jgi:hypothetical protein
MAVNQIDWDQETLLEVIAIGRNCIDFISAIRVPYVSPYRAVSAPA